MSRSNDPQNSLVSVLRNIHKYIRFREEDTLYGRRFACLVDITKYLRSYMHALTIYILYLTFLYLGFKK